MAQGDQYFLVSASGERIELTADLMIGRSPSCDLVLSQGHLSREHAKIFIETEGACLEDLDSLNGTFINGARLVGKKMLSDGDEVAFDSNKFSFELQQADADDRTIFRPLDQTAEHPNRTVLRPAQHKEALQAEAAVEARSVEGEAAGATSRPSDENLPGAEQQKAVTPGSWADPNAKNVSSTQFFSSEDLAAIGGFSEEVMISTDVPVLRVNSGAAAGSIIELIAEGGKQEWSLGSDHQRDIVFGDDGVSVFHTLLVSENNRWKLIDQMSTNGTFVNGTKTLTAYLNSGDQIRIGTTECTFILPDGGIRSTESTRTPARNLLTGVAAFVIVLTVMFSVYFLLL